MKRILILFAACFVFVFQACEKEELVKTNEVVTEGNVYTDLDGILHFNTGDDFFATNDLLAYMSDQELDSWEKSLGFVSLRSEVENVMSQLDRAKNEEEYYRIIENNKDIITISDDNVVPIINNHLYPRICNKDGYFYVGEVLHKATDQDIMASLDGKSETINSAIANSDFTDNTKVIIESYLNKSSLKSATIRHSAESTVVNDRYCMAYTDVIKEIYVYNDSYWRVRVTIGSAAYIKRSWPGSGYRLYNSAHACENVLWSINAPSYLQKTTDGTRWYYDWSNYTGSITQGGYTGEQKTMIWLNITYGILIRRDILTREDVYVDHESFSGSFWTQGSSPKKATLNF